MSKRPELSLQDRLAGFLAGAVIGANLAALTATAESPDQVRAILAGAPPRPLVPPPGTRRAPVALADAVVEELLGGAVDLRRLAARWNEWRDQDGLDADQPLDEALAHLKEFNAPALSLSRHGSMPLAATLPAALTATSPKSMISGTFHTARLLDPSLTTSLASVAVVLAAARFLEGSRDFIADVLAVLRVNDAPAPLFAAMQSIPRDPQAVPPAPIAGRDSPDQVARWALWHAHHRPRGVEVLESMVMRGNVPPAAGAVLGALLGARDGFAEWPREWVEADDENVRLRLALAERLADVVGKSTASE